MKFSRVDAVILMLLFGLLCWIALVASGVKVYRLVSGWFA